MNKSASVFRNTVVVDNTDWNNYHGTVAHHHVPIVAIVDAAVDASEGQTPPWQRQGDALKDILGYCFAAQPPEPLRAIGATWSLSDIIAPSRVIIDAGRMNTISRVSDLAWVHPGWLQGRSATGRRRHGRRGRHAGSGHQRCPRRAAISHCKHRGRATVHRIAGCIATGTHGSAISIGAVHDTVRGVYLLVSPLTGPSSCSPRPANPSPRRWRAGWAARAGLRRRAW